MQREADLQPNVSMLGGDFGERRSKPRLPDFAPGLGGAGWRELTELSRTVDCTALARQRTAFVGRSLPVASRHAPDRSRPVQRLQDGFRVPREVQEPLRRECKLFRRLGVPFISLPVRVNARRRDDIAAIGTEIEPVVRAGLDLPAPVGQREVEMAAPAGLDLRRFGRFAEASRQFGPPALAFLAVDVDNHDSVRLPGRETDVGVKVSPPSPPNFNFV